MSVCPAQQEPIAILLPKINVSPRHPLPLASNVELIVIAGQPLLNVIQLRIPALPVWEIRIVPRRMLLCALQIPVYLAREWVIATSILRINVLQLWFLQSVYSVEMIMIAAEPLLNVNQLQIPVLLVLIAHIVLQKRLPNAQHRIHVFLALWQVIAILIPKINVLLPHPLQLAFNAEIIMIAAQPQPLLNVIQLRVPASSVLPTRIVVQRMLLFALRICAYHVHYRLSVTLLLRKNVLRLQLLHFAFNV